MNKLLLWYTTNKRSDFFIYETVALLSHALVSEGQLKMVSLSFKMNLINITLKYLETNTKQQVQKFSTISC